MTFDLVDHPDSMPHDFLECLSKFLAELTDHRPLGIAVSGGSDSLGLLYGLAHLLPPGRLVALTVDHGLRAGSANEARQVKACCRRLGVRHETLNWDSGHPVTGVQAAARAARYRLLGEAAANHGLAAVVTAHTRDDQDETLEMRRARSLSETAPGLAGISPATLFGGHMWVLRPLLGVGRAQIRGFLGGVGPGKAGVEWIEDPSNRDERFERVRVRAMLKQKPADQRSLHGQDIAIARARLARRAADYIDANCRVEASGMVAIHCRPGEDADVVMAVIEALIDLCGGATRRLDRRGKATLGDIASSCINGADSKARAVTLGRTLVRHQGGDLKIRRECRGIETMALAPGASGVWDRRYRVENLDKRSFLTVTGGGAEGTSPLFRREADGGEAGRGGADGVGGGYLCQRLVGRNSHILPVHELPLAQALARLADTNGFPACPWTGIEPVLVENADKEP